MQRIRWILAGIALGFFGAALFFVRVLEPVEPTAGNLSGATSPEVLVEARFAEDAVAESSAEPQRNGDAGDAASPDDIGNETNDPYEKSLPELPEQPQFCMGLTFENSAALSESQLDECRRFLVLQRAHAEGSRMSELPAANRVLIEDRDDAWASYAESIILGAIASAPGVPPTYKVVCKETACVIEFDDQASPQVRALSLLDPVTGLYEFRAIQQGVDGPFDVYLSRTRESSTQAAAIPFEL